MKVLRNVEIELRRFRWRVLAAAAVVLLGFGLIGVRLFYLQVIRHPDLLAQAENNRTAVVPIVPKRGLILDRNGIVLAANYSAYTLEVTPSKIANLEQTIDALATIVTITARDRARFKRLRQESKNFASLPLRNRLSDQEVARFAAQRYRFPGVDIKLRSFRSYPLGPLASHVLGYIGRINAAEQEKIDDSDVLGNYRGTDYIGKLGVEQSFESELHGTTGFDLMETSAGGHVTRHLKRQPAMPGSNVQLSLDIKLQKLVENLYGQRRGALVALDPQTGQVLALVSMPTFDPNLFVDGIDQESWQQLNESIDKPLLNRALRGTYPPGSTYKPFMALAALATKARSAAALIDDPGYYMLGGHRFGSPENEKGGIMDMHRAIVESSNAYFYSLANKMGVDAIHDFMAPLGFGQLTGIDLPGELRGVLPSQAWKRGYFKRPEQKKWYAGETVSLGIGQGYNSFTMLQLAQATAIVANGGVKYRPHLLLAMQDSASQARTLAGLDAGVDLGFKPTDVDTVRRAMVGVTQEGTSSKVFAAAGYLSAGKTGTAQAVTVGKNEKYSALRLEERKRDHSLYIAFAPADHASIALALIVENAGFGTSAAAPIARRVFDYWLLGQYPSEQDIQAVRQGLVRAPIDTPRQAVDVCLGPEFAPRFGFSVAPTGAANQSCPASYARPLAPAALVASP